MTLACSLSGTPLPNAEGNGHAEVAELIRRAAQPDEAKVASRAPPQCPAEVVAILLADGWHRVVEARSQSARWASVSTPTWARSGSGAEEVDHGSPYRPAALVGSLSSILAVRQVNSAARDPSQLVGPAARRWARHGLA